MSKKIPVIEMFGPTIQGEGILAGKVTNFLRLGGCPYRCSWCDTMYAVLPEEIKKNATYLTEHEIAEKVCAELPKAPWINLTGGDPVMWDVGNLVAALHAANYRVSVETEGALWRNWLADVDQVTLSPKPPSSGMSDKTDMSLLIRYVNNAIVAFKVVVFDEADYEWARIMHVAFPHNPFYLSVGTPQGLDDEHTKRLIEAQLKWLFERVCHDPKMHDTITLPQLHVLAWGTKPGV